MSISLNVVPVREETLGQFTASDPWSSNPAEKWTLNLYRLVSETLAPSLKWKFLKKEQVNQADLGSRRSAVQS